MLSHSLFSLPHFLFSAFSHSFSFFPLLYLPLFSLSTLSSFFLFSLFSLSLPLFLLSFPSTLSPSPSLPLFSLSLSTPPHLTLPTLSRRLFLCGTAHQNRLQFSTKTSESPTRVFLVCLVQPPFPQSGLADALLSHFWQVREGSAGGGGRVLKEGGARWEPLEPNSLSRPELLSSVQQTLSYPTTYLPTYSSVTCLNSLSPKSNGSRLCREALGDFLAEFGRIFC